MAGPSMRLDRPMVEYLPPEPGPELGPAESSLDLLQAVYADPSQPLSRRMRAAIAALPFEHPKLSVTASINGEGFAAKLERAMQRTLEASPELRPILEQAEPDPELETDPNA
jgi:hypothetical protein